MNKCQHWQGIFDGGNRGRPMVERGCLNVAAPRYMALARATRPTEPGWNSRLPCWGRTGDAIGVCGSYAPQTDEATEAAKTRIKRMFSMIPDAVAQMQVSFQGAGTSEGAFPCSMDCGGKIDWVFTRDHQGRESSQGRCSSPDCVQWMT